MQQRTDVNSLVTMETENPQIDLTQPIQFITRPLFESDEDNDDSTIPHASIPCITTSNATCGVPTTYQAAIAILSLTNLSLEQLKNILHAIKLTGEARIRKGLKIKAIAIKMVQRKFSVDNVLEFIKKREDGNMSDCARRLMSFIETRVRETKDVDGNPKLEWVSGDVRSLMMRAKSFLFTTMNSCGQMLPLFLVSVSRSSQQVNSVGSCTSCKMAE